MKERFQDLWGFMVTRHKLWLAPIILSLLVARYIALLSEKGNSP